MEVLMLFGVMINYIIYRCLVSLTCLFIHVVNTSGETLAVSFFCRWRRPCKALAFIKSPITAHWTGRIYIHTTYANRSLLTLNCEPRDKSLYINLVHLSSNSFCLSRNPNVPTKIPYAISESVLPLVANVD